jgi:hypothetical protein
LQGVRVLDHARTAGPVATRFLAGLEPMFCESTRRIDEPGRSAEVTVVNVARLDLRSSSERAICRFLWRRTSSFTVPLDDWKRLGLDAGTRRKIRPGLVDVC